GSPFFDSVSEAGRRCTDRVAPSARACVAGQSHVGVGVSGPDSLHVFPPQTERAYQKQPTIFQNKKRVLIADGGKEAKEKLPRYHKSVGLGFKTPREAIDGTYIDKKCPFTGNVSIRGRILSGVVTKMKMQRTIVIRRDYLHYIRKYNRFEKRHKNISVHLSPCFRDVSVGDIVTVGECRPLSKTRQSTRLSYSAAGLQTCRKL
uniref:Small ribosomal subunit protein uS17 n=1 Tax=Scophthalmus maximus TaxID=52904 RepID=A0A8D2ZYN2_SCOMX